MKEWIVVNNISFYKLIQNYIILDKLRFIRDFKYCYKNNFIDCHFSGITANPSKEVMDSFNTAGPADDRNRLTDRRPTQRGKVYIPLINIDKQGVRELYEKYNLMDTLFPLTRSCETFTDDFSKHCGEYKDEKDVCWFCKERYWGFNRYE